ncbi:hypothetical protein H9P43_008912 [Blastocladiella emersonii ATCC 22665]|nr:hypothetical protein H9P43_008912 [Blastocladiella emersonii ATCC 22665]
MASLPPDSPPLEATLLVKREAQVFPIPPRTRAEGYKAADWDTSKAWSGRLRVLHVTYASPAAASRALGPALAKQMIKPSAPEGPWSLCVVKLEDSMTGELFGESLVRDPDTDVERVLDSSRYFVIRLTDRASARHAWVGFGFAERADAFDWNVAMQDFAKQVKYETGGAAALGGAAAAAAAVAAGPPLDLGLKEGQQIKINIGVLAKKLGGTSATAAPAPAALPAGGADTGFFPPPPPAGTNFTPFAAPPAAGAPFGAFAAAAPAPSSFAAFDDSPFGAFSAPPPAASKRHSGGSDDWADFTAAAAPPPKAAGSPSASGAAATGWVQF